MNVEANAPVNFTSNTKRKPTANRSPENRISLKKVKHEPLIEREQKSKNTQVNRVLWSKIPSVGFNELLEAMSPEDQKISLLQKSQAISCKTPWGAVAWEDFQGESYVGPAYEYSKIASMIATNEFTPEFAADKDSIKNLFTKTSFHLFIGSSQKSVNLGTIDDMRNHGIGIFEAISLFQGHQGDLWCKQISKEVVSLIKKTGIYPIESSIPLSFFEDQLVLEAFPSKEDAHLFKTNTRYELFKVLAGDDNNFFFKHMLFIEKLNPFAIRYEEDTSAAQIAEKNGATENLVLIRQRKNFETTF